MLRPRRSSVVWDVVCALVWMALGLTAVLLLGGSRLEGGGRAGAGAAAAVA